MAAIMLMTAFLLWLFRGVKFFKAYLFWIPRFVYCNSTILLIEAQGHGHIYQVNPEWP